MSTTVRVKQIVDGLKKAKTKKAYKESLSEFWKYTNEMYPKYRKILNKIGPERITEMGIEEEMDELLLNILGVMSIVTNLEEALEV